METQTNVVHLPVLPLRGLTVFPGLTLQFDIGRESSVQVLEKVLQGDMQIFLLTQRDLGVENPSFYHLYDVGTVATVKQALRLQGDHMRVMVEGKFRGRLAGNLQTEPYLHADVECLEPIPSPAVNSKRVEAAIRQAYACVERFYSLSDRVSPDLYVRLLNSEDPAFIADCAAQNLPLRFQDKQSLLEELQPGPRVLLLTKILSRELEILETQADLAHKIHQQVQSSQREYFLREQLRVVQKELGDDTSDADDFNEYKKKIANAKMPEEIREHLMRELARLKKQPYSSSESGVLRNYLDTCLELPWMEKTDERINVAAVEKALNKDHYGLDKVKERILEFVAVKQLSPNLKGQVLCLVGPPGVGKTSIAMSVAGAINRRMARISLGGIRDEADIRGHRKTYVGAMPGRIIAGIQQAGSANPVLLLDEIDKVGSDGRGDPAAALLEVLDTEQNSTFRDHFLELPFDLSDVMFITTANTTETIPRPLLDRMEVIELPSYTDTEKLEIAKRHLLPKEMKRHGLNKNQLRISDDAISGIIQDYTRESGVRLLERSLASLCRKAASKLVKKECKRVTVDRADLPKLLGPAKYTGEELEQAPVVGLVNGLAWTSAGGELLQVEVNVVPGTGQLHLTGNLGDVMKESCQAAITYIRSRADVLGIPENFYKEKDIHVHFPEGAVPKDGPSAGIAITTAVVSALTGIPVRQDIAMTGEVTLRGRVLPIGGLREKTMAAHRNKISTVILPKKNEKDLEEIDPIVRSALHFIPVEQADEVLTQALAGSLKAIQPEAAQDEAAHEPASAPDAEAEAEAASEPAPLADAGAVLPAPDQPTVLLPGDPLMPPSPVPAPGVLPKMPGIPPLTQ